MLLCVHLKKTFFPFPFFFPYTKVTTPSLSPMSLNILTVLWLHAKAYEVCVFQLECRIKKNPDLYSLVLKIKKSQPGLV